MVPTYLCVPFLSDFEINIIEFINLTNGVLRHCVLGDDDKVFHFLYMEEKRENTEN